MKTNNRLFLELYITTIALAFLLIGFRLGSVIKLDSSVLNSLALIAIALLAILSIRYTPKYKELLLQLK